MFNGDCLSLNNDNGNAFLSHHVMLPTHATFETQELRVENEDLALMNF